MQVKEPTFSVSNMFTFNSQQYLKYFDFVWGFRPTQDFFTGHVTGIANSMLYVFRPTRELFTHMETSP